MFGPLEGRRNMAVVIVLQANFFPAGFTTMKMKRDMCCGKPAGVFRSIVGDRFTFRINPHECCTEKK